MIIRSLVVVLGSYAVMMLLVVVTTAIAAKVLVPSSDSRPGGMLTPAYLSVNLIAAAAAALLGGWLVARFAATAPFAHGVALAVVVALMGLVSMRTGRVGGQPRWYALVLAGGMPLLVLAGAWLQTLQRMAAAFSAALGV